MNIFEKLLCKLLDETSENIKSGNCEVTQEDWEQASKLIGHRRMSKEEACNYLRIPRSTFDYKIKIGELPRGYKRSGWKELSWYKDELDEFILNHK